jgi:hypothetical protein
MTECTTGYIRVSRMDVNGEVGAAELSPMVAHSDDCSHRFRSKPVSDTVDALDRMRQRRWSSRFPRTLLPRDTVDSVDTLRAGRGRHTVKCVNVLLPQSVKCERLSAVCQLNRQTWAGSGMAAFGCATSKS